jgi:hypothetical protein
VIDSTDDVEMNDDDDCTDELQFSLEDITNAAKESNFNKGLGPDCFDGNLL